MSAPDQLAGISRAAIERLRARERDAFLRDHPNCIAAAWRSAEHWLNGVPMHWMTDWDLPCPLIVAEAHGATLTDVDGRRYADFCLGDTGAMFGHSPQPVVDDPPAIGPGFTCMLPIGADGRAGDCLAERFALPSWQMTQTATDANRAVLRWARALTRREQDSGVRRLLSRFARRHARAPHRRSRQSTATGQIGQVFDFARTRASSNSTILPRSNAIAHGDVACLLAEPVMTNAGMVFPQDGFWRTARELCGRHERARYRR